MPNLKFSQFQEQTDSANVQFVVGYNGTDNVRIAPGNLGGGYPFLIDTQSLYSGFVPSGLSGNPQGNTILGISAGNSLTTSSNNTLIGDSAGKSIINNSTQNVIVGANAGEFKTTGSQSVLIGREAGKNSSGGVNILIGYQAGLSSTASNTIAIGENAARVNQSSTHLSIGASAGYSNTTGSGNTNVGYQAGAQITTGANNTNLGYQAGTNVTGNNNVLLGWKAGSDAGAWSNTIIIGYDGETSPAGQSNFIVLGNTNHTTLQIPGIQSGASNGDVLTFNSSAGKLELQTPSAGGLTPYAIPSGKNAIYAGFVPTSVTGAQNVVLSGGDTGTNLTTGQDNILIGYRAGVAITTSNSNVCIGSRAGQSITTSTGFANTIVGTEAGANSGTSGATAIGWLAGNRSNTVSIGDQAGRSASGSANLSVHIGSNAGYSNSGSTSIMIGGFAARNNSGDGHTSIGYNAGYSQTSGTKNTNVGYKTGYSTTTGNSNIYIGYESGQGTTTGFQNVAIGVNALDTVANKFSNTAVGHQAGRYVVANANTFVGKDAGRGDSNGATGGANVVVGGSAYNNFTSGSGNTVLGYQCLINGTHTGSNNVFIGRDILLNTSFSGSNSIAIGYQAAPSSGSVSNEITLGNSSVTSFRIPGIQSGASDGDVLTFNSSAGKLELQAAGGGGASSLNGLTDCLVDTASLYVGEIPSGLSGNPQGNTLLGIDAGLNAITTFESTLIGNKAGSNYVGGDRNTVIGFEAQHKASGSTNNSNDCTAIGWRAAAESTSAYYSTFLGSKAGYAVGGFYNTFIGRNSGSSSSTTTNRTTAIGSDSLYKLSLFCNDNTALGFQSGYNLSQGEQNVLLGVKAGDALTNGTNNIVIGFEADASSATVSNEITLGDANISALRCAVTSITSLSDERDKSEIKDLEYGLAFIDALQPREFVWDNRPETKEVQKTDENGIVILDEEENPITETQEFYSANKGKKDFGFIAQEVRELDNDTLRLVYTENEDKLELSYGKLVPILVKAIQELKEEVEILKSQNN